jgi:hypothetical protein
VKMPQNRSLKKVDLRAKDQFLTSCCFVLSIALIVADVAACARQAAGDMPVARLKARLKAASDSQPLFASILERLLAWPASMPSVC